MLHRVRIVALLDSLLHISGFWEWIDAATSILLLLAVVSLLSAWHLDGQRALLLREYLLATNRLAVETLRHFLLRLSAVENELGVPCGCYLFIFAWRRLLLFGPLLPVDVLG